MNQISFRVVGVTNHLARRSIVALRAGVLAVTERQATHLVERKAKLSALLEMESKLSTRQAKTLIHRAILTELAYAIREGYRPSHTPTRTLSYRESRGLV